MDLDPDRPDALPRREQSSQDLAAPLEREGRVAEDRGHRPEDVERLADELLSLGGEGRVLASGGDRGLDAPELVLQLAEGGLHLNHEFVADLEDATRALGDAVLQVELATLEGDDAVASFVGAAAVDLEAQVVFQSRERRLSQELFVDDAQHRALEAVARQGDLTAAPLGAQRAGADVGRVDVDLLLSRDDLPPRARRPDHDVSAVGASDEAGQEVLADVAARRRALRVDLALHGVEERAIDQCRMRVALDDPVGLRVHAEAAGLEVVERRDLVALEAMELRHRTDVPDGVAAVDRVEQERADRRAGPKPRHRRDRAPARRVGGGDAAVVQVLRDRAIARAVARHPKHRLDRLDLDRISEDQLDDLALVTLCTPDARDRLDRAVGVAPTTRVPERDLAAGAEPLRCRLALAGERPHRELDALLAVLLEGKEELSLDRVGVADRPLDRLHAHARRLEAMQPRPGLEGVEAAEARDLMDQDQVELAPIGVGDHLLEPGSRRVEDTAHAVVFVPPPDHDPVRGRVPLEFMALPLQRLRLVLRRTAHVRDRPQS